MTDEPHIITFHFCPEREVPGLYFFEDGRVFYRVTTTEAAWVMLERTAMFGRHLGYVTVNGRQITALPGLVRELSRMLEGLVR